MSLSVKAYLRLQDGEEIRRFSVPQEASTSYAYFVEKIQRVFPQLLRQEFTIAWKDSDGEKVTFSSDDELTEALGNLNGEFFRVYIDGPGEQKKRPASAESDQEHPGVICDACDGKIRGSRFKCTTCPDFDLCANCEGQGFHSEHEMLRIRVPRSGPYHPRCGGGPFRGGPRGCGGRRGKGPWKHCRPPFHPHAFAHSFAFGPGAGEAGAAPGFAWAWPDPSAWSQHAGDTTQSEPAPTSSGNDNEKEAGANEQQGQRQQQPPDMATVFKAVSEMMGSLFTNQTHQQQQWGAQSEPTQSAQSEGAGSNNADDTQTPSPAPSSTAPAAEDQPTTPTPTATSSTPDFVMVDNNRPAIPAQLTSEEIFQIRLNEATAQLEQMGFKDEGGWLRRLLIEKHCDVGKVLDVLQPAKSQ